MIVLTSISVQVILQFYYSPSLGGKPIHQVSDALSELSISACWVLRIPISVFQYCPVNVYYLILTKSIPRRQTRLPGAWVVKETWHTKHLELSELYNSVFQLCHESWSVNRPIFYHIPDHPSGAGPSQRALCMLKGLSLRMLRAPRSLSHVHYIALRRLR